MSPTLVLLFLSLAVVSSTIAQTITGGFATFFAQNGFAGACGSIHSNSDLIGAIAIDFYGSPSTVSPLCGKRVHITNTNNNKSVTITVADACVTCVNGNSFDLSFGSFDAIAQRSDGIVPIIWNFV